MEYKHLSKILKGKASQKEDILIAYSRDASPLTAKPKFLVRATSEKDVKKVIDYANRYRHYITPRGFASSNVGGAVGNDIILDLTPMNIVRYNESKEYVEFGAGATPQMIEENLPISKSIYFKPCTLSYPSFGGIIAAGIHGQEGTREDWLSSFIEVHAIDGTGKKHIIKDIDKLWGSEGTLFVITHIKMRVVNKNEYRSYTIKSFNSLIDALVEGNRALNESSIVRVDLYNPIISQLLKLPKKWHLVKAYDQPVGHYRTKEAIAPLPTNLDRVHFHLYSMGFVSQESWVDKNTFFEVLNKATKSKIPALLHLHNNYIHFYTEFSQDMSQLSEIYKFMLLHASLPGGHGYGILKKKFVPLHIKRKFFKLKEIYDYNNVLNPGKIIDYR